MGRSVSWKNLRELDASTGVFDHVPDGVFLPKRLRSAEIAFQGRDAALALHKKRPPSEVGEPKPTKRSK